MKLCKVNKELKLFPLDPSDNGRFKPVTIGVVECDNFDDANMVLRGEYLRYRDMLSKADQERYDEILK